LLDLLVGVHSEVVSVGELRRLHEHYNGNFACTCEKIFCDCPFWGRVNNELEQGGASLAHMETLIPGAKSAVYDLAYFLPGPVLAMLSSRIDDLGRAFRIAGNNLRIADTVCKTENVKILIDSSKVFKFGRLYNLIRPNCVKSHISCARWKRHLLLP
jgi:hypothetical protein